MNFEEYARREEQHEPWTQRCRELWLKQEDKNSELFQRIFNAHKRNNYIDKLLVGGEFIEEPKI